MNKYVKFLILAVIIVAGFIGVKLVYDNLSEEYQPESGLMTESEKPSSDEPSVNTSESEESAGDEEAKAIDFTVEDIDGNKISLHSKIGKPMVVNFWASWCSPCKAELPDFQKAYDDLDGQVEFMMVNLTDGRSETVKTASSYIESQGYTFPVYYDVNQEAAMAYYVVSIPTTYFIDSAGNVVASAQGMIDYDTLMKGIGMIK